MSLILPVTAGQLPGGFCPQTLQEMLNGFSAAQSVSFQESESSLTGILMQSNKPSDTTKAWFRLDSFGAPVGLYKFASGLWISPHPELPGFTKWWFNILPDLNTFDGATSDPVSDYGGPMWQVAKDLNGNLIQAKIPITPGTLASGTVLSNGDTGGEERHVLTVDELPAHRHSYTTVIAGTGIGGGAGLQLGTENSGSVGSGSAHNNLPPYIVGYLLQRTARKYYAVS